MLILEMRFTRKKYILRFPNFPDKFVKYSDKHGILQFIVFVLIYHN